jgi:Ca2+-binding RTX toxin-like protein
MALFDTTDQSTGPNLQITNISKAVIVSFPTVGYWLSTLLLDGNDTVLGSQFSDSLKGFDGNDTLVGGAGGDILVGGTGTDTASYATAAAAVVVVMEATSSNTGDALGDSYNSIENLAGSAFNDVLYGTTNIANVLNGAAGNDILVGRGGADRFIGGAGLDTVSYDSSFTGVRADLLTPGVNTGNAAGNTYSSIENLDGSSLSDTLLGNNSANTIRGSSYATLVSGNDGLYGRGGADKLFGFDGNDTLEGGTGQDIATGGAGNDVFLFRSALIAANRDRITDFNVANDTIRIDNAVFTKLTGVNVTLSSAQFHKGSGAHDTSDRIIYNSANGALLYDADGNTAGGVAAIQFATLNAGLGITRADFFIV